MSCDFLIIGSGAAGGVLAGTLSELTNKKIILVEKGGFYQKGFFNQKELPMAKALYTEGNQRAALGSGIPIRGGECVGGGTTINLALCFDPVQTVWNRWTREYGLNEFSFTQEDSDYGIPDLNITNCLNHIRKRCSITVAPDDQVNDNNRLFQEGCQKKGISSEKFELNMKGCIGCGFCASGCAYDAKQGTMITYISDAIKRGVEVIHYCDVHKIKIGNSNRAEGIIGKLDEVTQGSLPRKYPVGNIEIDAKMVILAAGAIESPILLKKSKSPDPYNVIGKGLVLHPSLPVIGVYPKEISNYRGITGSYFSKHFYQSHNFYLECLFGHPVYAATVLPFFGKDHYGMLRNFTKTIGFGVMLVDEVISDNRVEWDPVKQIRKIYYHLSPNSKNTMRFAAKKALEIMFAAGVSKALLPSEEYLAGYGFPQFSDLSQVHHVNKLNFTPHQTTITSAHPQATVKMSENPKKGYLNSRSEVHYVKNLVVCDSSSFPTSCGANPMISIMTMARYQGIRIAKEMNRYF